jgi:hypothetical protein
LFLKDSRHFVLFEASIKKAQEVFSSFWNEDHFKAFRLTRKNGKSISGGSRPLAPERLSFLAVDVDEEILTQNEEVAMSSVEQVEEELNELLGNVLYVKVHLHAMVRRSRNSVSCINFM